MQKCTIVDEIFMVKWPTLIGRSRLDGPLTDVENSNRFLTGARSYVGLSEQGTEYSVRYEKQCASVLT